MKLSFDILSLIVLTSFGSQSSSLQASDQSCAMPLENPPHSIYQRIAETAHNVYANVEHAMEQNQKKIEHSLEKKALENAAWILKELSKREEKHNIGVSKILDGSSDIIEELIGKYFPDHQ